MPFSTLFISYFFQDGSLKRTHQIQASEFARKTMSNHPIDFICPLSQKVMLDPVQSPEGVSFERDAITKVLAFRSVCPVNGTPLRLESLRTNAKLQWMIRFWQLKIGNGENRYNGEEENRKHEIFPRRFLCPLTRDVMTGPVTIREGANFEKLALLQYMDKHGEISPISREPLGRPCFYPNQKLAAEIRHYTMDIEEANKLAQLPQVKEAASSKFHALPTKNANVPTIERILACALPTNILVRGNTLFQSEEKNVMSILGEVCGILISA